ncbi:molybdate ABC transporter substrate-binding protein [Roseibium litorale]|uniref:Molybdate ABC transporter substrate-binding protein n=1 Tax=Roseibium litorale TaxID=2803841 RepID=A0ABR9CR64_9HYPH|nr:molybdate ABC transporter substrate-binding protein [Roseibium litorale]MBD8893372.1 molybdate ABC transporter substrate-binding protein [Roseibium litorale]
MRITERLTKPAIAALASLLLLAPAAHAEEVLVAVAANFTDAMRDIAREFEKETGHKAVVSFASTGKLYAQIENGAPFEVFLAADSQRPEKAEAEGLAVPGSRFTYAKGKLALWSPTQGLFTGGEEFLKTGTFSHVAIANPKTAPYGLAARQALIHMSLWNTLSPWLVHGDTIAQTFQFVASGNAELGFVALSQLKALPDKTGSSWEIPESYYEPITQQAVLLKKGETNPAARAFIDFLKGGTAQDITVSYGYGVE